VNKTQNKWFTIILMTTTLIICVVFVAGYPFRSSSALQVSFVRFTNDVTMGKMAVFVLTNSADEPIICMGCYPQIEKSDGSWAEVRLAPHYDQIPEILAHTTTETAIPLTTNSYFWRDNVLLCATNVDVWREPFWWYYFKKSKFEYYRGLISENLSLNWMQISHLRRQHYFNESPGGSHYAYSDIITNK
jgi:hypothetical protein